MHYTKKSLPTSAWPCAGFFIPRSIAVFRDHIYVGTAIEAAVFSANPDQDIVPPKDFDVIRIDKNDNWELVVGGTPVVPTDPHVRLDEGLLAS